MTKEEVIIRAVCGNRRRFTTFSVVLIRTDSGKQFRLDINRVKGDKLYGDELDAVNDIADETEKRIGEKRAILRHKYADYEHPDFRTIWTIKPRNPDSPPGKSIKREGSPWRVRIPD